MSATSLEMRQEIKRVDGQIERRVNGRSREKVSLKSGDWDFPGSPVVKTPHFHCRGREFET